MFIKLSRTCGTIIATSVHITAMPKIMASTVLINLQSLGWGFFLSSSFLNCLSVRIITGFSRYAIAMPQITALIVPSTVPSAPIITENFDTTITSARHMAKVITVYTDTVVYLLFQSTFIGIILSVVTNALCVSYNTDYTPFCDICKQCKSKNTVKKRMPLPLKRQRRISLIILPAYPRGQPLP